MIAALAFAAAGVLLGLCQLHPALAACAWAGVALLAFAIHRTASPGRRAAGVLLAEVLAIAITFSNLPSTMALYFPERGLAGAVLGAAVVWLAYALLAGAPIAAVAASLAALARRGRARRVGEAAFLWLPPAWLLGEALRARVARLSIDWLFSQWRVEPVLRTLSRFGWVPTALVCLAAAASAGDFLWRRRPARLVPALAGAALLLAEPPIPPSDLHVFDGIALVHTAAPGEVPSALPAGARVVIWPEGTLAWQPKLAEGAHGRHIEPPIEAVGAAQLLGAKTAEPKTLLAQNSVLALDAKGTLLGTRAKRLLLPVTEEALSPFADPAEYFEPGAAPPLLDVGGLRVVPLVCLESISRELIAEGMAHGGQIVAVLASDRAMVGLAPQNRQALAVLVMRAVELHVPSVRASNEGYAAFVAPDGRVLARSALGTTGVLMVAADRKDGSPEPRARVSSLP